MFHMYLKKWIFCCQWAECAISVRCSWLAMFFLHMLTDFLSTRFPCYKARMINSPARLSVFPFSSVRICFIYSKALSLSAYTVMMPNLLKNFIIMKFHSLYLIIFLIKVHFSYINMFTAAFHWLLSVQSTIFYDFTFILF
jgi:hypothetical protein